MYLSMSEKQTFVSEKDLCLSSRAWGKGKGKMEQLQYIENEMRAFTDNAVTKCGCSLRVRAGDWN